MDIVVFQTNRRAAKVQLFHGRAITNHDNKQKEKGAWKSEDKEHDVEKKKRKLYVFLW